MSAPCRIAGLGAAVPVTVIPSATIDTRLGREPGWTEARQGVRERRHADPALGETAVSLGVAAATEALADAGVGAHEVDLLLNASGTPIQAIPDGAVLLQRALGLGASGRPAYSVHATCLSFVVALDVASMWIASGRARTVLIVSTELASPGLNLDDPETAGLFGDGAAAAVITAPAPTGTLDAFRLETYGDQCELAQIPGGGSARSPMRGGTALDGAFQMNGPRLLRATLEHMPAFLDHVVPDRAVPDLVVPHQASRVGLEIAERSGFRPGVVARTLETLGNVVAASIPLTLHAAAREGRLRRGDRVLLVGTGAGLSLGAALLTW